MVRVEWSALSGDDVEAVLSNLLYNAHNRALRIRPAQGDFGIDVVVPSGKKPETWDVYQIKKFAQNLDASQKSQIEGSFRRVLVGLVRREVPLENWYLVTPLDPTLDNALDWFRNVPERAIAHLRNDTRVRLTSAEEEQIRAWLTTPRRVIDWKGLDFCQSLAADYPYVVDYYLHGGEQRLREAVSDLAQLLRQDMNLAVRESAAASKERAVALLEPGEIREHLLRLDRVLDTDPHFKYGHSLEPNQPPVVAEPDLLAATQEQIAGGRWLTFKIYQRSAQSLDQRPIPLDLSFNFEESPGDRQAFEDWRKYGKPFETMASFRADLPGGLRGEFKEARVHLSPSDEQERAFRVRFRILTPDGNILSELGFGMVSASGLDATGSWAHGTDDSGALETEGFVDTEAMAGRFSFTAHPLAGMEAVKISQAITFAAHLVAPNRLQIAGEYGPFFDYSSIGSSSPLVDPTVGQLVHDLATIQNRATFAVLVPGDAALSREDLIGIRRAAALIEGRVLVRTWTEFAFTKNRDIQIDPSGHYQIEVTMPLDVSLGGRVVSLGAVAHRTLSASIESVEGDKVRAVPHLNNTVHLEFLQEMPSTREGKYPIRYRRLPDPGANPHDGGSSDPAPLSE